MPRSRQQIGILAASVSAIGLAATWMWLATPDRLVSRPVEITRPASPPSISPASPLPALPPERPAAPARPVPVRRDVSVTQAPLKPMSFEPADGNLLFTGDLQVRLIGSQVKIVERRRPLVRWTPGRGHDVTAQAPRQIWSGPVADALFVYEMTEGVDTLRDRKGTVLWSNAAENAMPDLLLDRLEDGQARLLDKKRALLWSGTLPPESTHGSSMRRSGKTFEYHSSGIHIKGGDSVSTVTDDAKRLLWSGALPPEPVLLLRRGQTFTFMGPSGSASGNNFTVWLRLSVEKGDVTVEDAKRRRIGAQSLDLLKVSQENVSPEASGKPLTMRFAPRYILPKPSARHKTDVFYTYADSLGKVIGVRKDLSTPPLSARDNRRWRREPRTVIVSQGHQP